MVIVSACLAGIRCRYDGESTPCSEVQKLMAEGLAIPVCPEQLGGCTTPRPTTEISGGSGADVLDGNCRVVTKDGKDVTKHFLKGAEEVLRIATLAGVKRAVLKARSPSCGCGVIYDGTFSGRRIPGNGVTAELLIRNGILVETEKE